MANIEIYMNPIFSVVLSETWHGGSGKAGGGIPRWSCFVNMRWKGGKGFALDLLQLLPAAEQIEKAAKHVEQPPPFASFSVAIPHQASFAKTVRIVGSVVGLVHVGPLDNNHEFRTSQARTLAKKLRDAYALAQSHGYVGARLAEVQEVSERREPFPDSSDRQHFGTYEVFDVYIEGLVRDAPDLVLRRTLSQKEEWAIPVSRLAFLEKWLQLRQPLRFAGKCGVHCSPRYEYRFADEEARRGLLADVKRVMRAAQIPSRQGPIVWERGGIVVGQTGERLHIVDELLGFEITFPLVEWGWVFVHASDERYVVKLNKRRLICGDREFTIDKSTASEIFRALEEPGVSMQS